MEEPVAFDLTFFAVTLIVGIALNYAAALLAPRQQRQKEPARLEPRTEDGQDVVSSSRFTSRSSFTGLQNVVELNSPVPIVFAKRELIDGTWYGGVRVNTNRLWTQVWSVSGSQLVRAIFLVGEGCIKIDSLQTAMGDNLLGNYDLEPSDPTNDYGRATLYFNCASAGPPQPDPDGIYEVPGSVVFSVDGLTEYRWTGAWLDYNFSTAEYDEVFINSKLTAQTDISLIAFSTAQVVGGFRTAINGSPGTPDPSAFTNIAWQVYVTNEDRWGNMINVLTARSHKEPRFTRIQTRIVGGTEVAVAPIVNDVLDPSLT